MFWLSNYDIQKGLRRLADLPQHESGPGFDSWYRYFFLREPVLFPLNGAVLPVAVALTHLNDHRRFQPMGLKLIECPQVFQMQKKHLRFIWSHNFVL